MVLYGNANGTALHSAEPVAPPGGRTHDTVCVLQADKVPSGHSAWGARYGWRPLSAVGIAQIAGGKRSCGGGGGGGGGRLHATRRRRRSRPRPQEANVGGVVLTGAAVI